MGSSAALVTPARCASAAVNGKSIEFNRLSSEALFLAASAPADVQSVIAESVEAGEIFTAAQLRTGLKPASYLPVPILEPL